ncbi:uncharacterized protein G2W53_000446 [Senna tora]|uniref:Uncharacterized protein n=1 Tax=Senna tora TaxID=362788 RepID=A0A835CJG9_9FABA|nr:uncharacterized protein G2W53_000446 [Senna tora]
MGSHECEFSTALQHKSLQQRMVPPYHILFESCHACALIA